MQNKYKGLNVWPELRGKKHQPDLSQRAPTQKEIEEMVKSGEFEKMCREMNSEQPLTARQLLEDYKSGIPMLVDFAEGKVMTQKQLEAIAAEEQKKTEQLR